MIEMMQNGFHKSEATEEQRALIRRFGHNFKRVKREHLRNIAVSLSDEMLYELDSMDVDLFNTIKACIYTNIGTVHTYYGEWDTAIEALKKALILCPDRESKFV